MMTEDPNEESGDDDVHSRVFDSFGILESILTYVEARDLLQATLVNRRWKKAGRADSLWQVHIEKLWDGKIGFGNFLPQEEEENETIEGNETTAHNAARCLIFWRTLYTAECVQKMSPTQIASVFDHPLLADQRAQMQQVLEKEGDAALKNFYTLHMLDIVSGSSQFCCFHSDTYFGSYSSSLQDSRRDTITLLELCNPFGFVMYFKVARDNVDEAEQLEFTVYEESEEILLYKYGFGYFEDDYGFRMSLREDVHIHHPTDLTWHWLENGRKLQVATYPSLTASRTKKWGWKLENIHVILLIRDAMTAID